MSSVPDGYTAPAKRWGSIAPTDAEHAALVADIVAKQKLQDEIDRASHQVGMLKKDE